MEKRNHTTCYMCQ